MESFEEFLVSKKINAETFEKRDKEQFERLKSLFEQVHPNSFVAQKLFVINGIRRSYPLQQVAAQKTEAPKKIKPKIKLPTKKS